MDKDISPLKGVKTTSNLFRKGKRKQGELFSFTYLKNNDNILRYVISAPKKIYKKAVDRNKIRRQVRMMLNDIKLRGYDVLICINKKYSENSYKINKENFIIQFNMVK